MSGIHLAIIPDGNRRWAKRKGKSIKEGHWAGIQKLKKLIEWCKDLDVTTLSIWILSTENMKRSKEEVDALFDLFNKMLDELLSSKDFEKARKEISITFVGDFSSFPKEIKDKIDRIHKLTSKNKKYKLGIFCNYGGRKELIDAANKMIKDAKTGKLNEVNENTFSNYLYAPHLGDPDIIFRSGGEVRLSGFMPWQSVYSELYFCKKLWPDITKKDFYSAIEEIKKRERRFGR
ncbi:MAG: polyprenyl diphosphate synthase [Candidatus Micrarchaeia archaeon]